VGQAGEPLRLPLIEGCLPGGLPQERFHGSGTLLFSGGDTNSKKRRVARTNPSTQSVIDSRRPDKDGLHLNVRVEEGREGSTK